MKNIFQGKYGPLLIAEIGGNHEGSFARAKELTELALATGVDCVKYQIFSGDTLISSVEDPERHEHYNRLALSPPEYLSLAKKVRSSGLMYSSSVWNSEAIDWINEHISIYKIGSGDLTAYPLLKRIARTEKPVIISTGLSTEKEVIDAVEYIQSVNEIYKDPNKLAILQCTSMYPINPEDAHLNVIQKLKDVTGLRVGYSNHTEGMKSLFYATALGADILEFHFTDNREGKSYRDHRVSLMPDEVKQLIAEIKLIKQFQGSKRKQPTDIEHDNGHTVSFRRAVYPERDIVAGEYFTEDNLTVLRPNCGIDSRDYERIIGRRAKVNIRRHQKMSWEYIE